MGGLAEEYCGPPHEAVDFYAFISASVLFYVLNSLYVIKFYIFKYKNVKKIEERELLYFKNKMAKRARVKSIFFH
jgi:hypothetical protein